MTITREEGNRRLLALARFLEKLPINRFSYNRWVGNDWRGKPDLSCGTTACAMGWATTMPRFRRLGLVMNSLGVPVLRDHWGLEAAEKLFALTPKQAEFMFIPSRSYRQELSPGISATASEVAAHIRRFVARRQ